MIKLRDVNQFIDEVKEYDRILSMTRKVSNPEELSYEEFHNIKVTKLDLLRNLLRSIYDCYVYYVNNRDSYYK